MIVKLTNYFSTLVVSLFIKFTRKTKEELNVAFAFYYWMTRSYIKTYWLVANLRYKP